MFGDRDKMGKSLHGVLELFWFRLEIVNSLVSEDERGEWDGA